MKNKVFIANLFFVVMFLLGRSVALASLTPLPAPVAPLDQRDKYQTDLYTGSASYIYPIKVPKGTNELTPNVTISYNSLGAKDLMQKDGIGWTLDQDFMERDVNSTPVNLGDDKFKLHFQGQSYR